MKAWWKSKTLWFNAFATMLVAIEAVFHVLQPLLGPVVYPVALVVITGTNALLRTITKQGLTVAKPKS